MATDFEKNFDEEASVTQQLCLNGEYRFKVDGRGRISLPAKFRKVLPNLLVVTMEPEDECLYVFRPEDYEKWIDQLFDRRFGGFDESNRTHQGLRRKLKGRAFDVDVDASGRMNITKELREQVGIKDYVVVLGNTGRFEIWNPDVYDAQLEEVDLSLLYSE